MKRCAQGQVSVPVICGTGAGGFTFIFVRVIVKLSTNWRNTMLTHVAGALYSLASIRGADTLAAILAPRDMASSYSTKCDAVIDSLSLFP